MNGEKERECIRRIFRELQHIEKEDMTTAEKNILKIIQNWVDDSQCSLSVIFDTK